MIELDQLNEFSPAQDDLVIRSEAVTFIKQNLLDFCVSLVNLYSYSKFEKGTLLLEDQNLTVVQTHGEDPEVHAVAQTNYLFVGFEHAAVLFLAWHNRISVDAHLIERAQPYDFGF